MRASDAVQQGMRRHGAQTLHQMVLAVQEERTYGQCRPHSCATCRPGCGCHPPSGGRLPPAPPHLRRRWVVAVGVFFGGGGVGSSRPPATSATLPQTAATCFRAWRCEPCRSVVAPHRRRSLAPVGGDSRSCVASSWRSGWARPGPTAHGNCAWRALHVVGAAAFTQVSPGCDRGACGVGCPAAVDEGPAAADGRPPHAVDADGGGGGCSR